MKRRSKTSRRYKRKEGLFEELRSLYGSSCLICGGETRLVIDHDHTTGKVRGLLCYTHNTGLGMFQDNKDLLMSAIRYLENFQSDEPPILKKKKTPFPFRQRLEELVHDTSFRNDVERAETLHKESGITSGVARTRISRWRKSHLQGLIHVNSESVCKSN